ncbi:MAG TPA: PDZ domain-containing protein [Terriglobales bacterium]|nr:PDZ domain-containing protein [Terriglobales bacterium]
MGNRGIRILAIMLLAGVSYAQTAPAPPAPPAQPAPATPSVEEPSIPSNDEIQKQVDDARKQADEARREAAKARVEANKERRTALAEARKARAAAQAASRGAYLGVVDPSDVTPEKAAALKLKEGRGVVIGMVDHDSPAGKAGLKEHDVILSLNGQRVDNTDGLRRIIRETTPGKSVPITVSRNGQQLTMNVQLEKRPQWARIEVPKFDMPMPPMPPDIDIPSFSVLQYSARNGVMVEDLSPQLADFFGVKDGQGVLVRSVEKGSAADAAGLKAGDVIVKAGGERVTCSADWRRAMREHKGSIPVAIVRDKREQSVTMKLPERKTSDASIGFEKEMQNLKIEMQKMKPEFDRQMNIAQVRVAREMAAHQKDFVRMQQELNKMGEEFRKSFQSEGSSPQER